MKSKVRFRAWLAAATLPWILWCSAVPAQTAPAPAPGEQTPPPESSEQLYVLPPPAWKVGYDQRLNGVELIEVIPPTETIQNWSQMLTVEIIDNPPKKSAADVLKDQLSQLQTECDAVGAGPSSLATENGYQTALRAIACTKSKKYGKGEMNLYKVLHGRDRLYIVARSWRGAAFDKDHLPLQPAMTEDWLSFMNRVTLCDTRDPGRACPQPLAAGRH